MTPEEARELPLGLYRLFWISGGHSLAAVGQTRDGSRWYAPTNWLSPQDIPSPAESDWSVVVRVECIIANKERWHSSLNTTACDLLKRLGLYRDSALVEQILAALRRNNLLVEEVDAFRHIRQTMVEATQCAEGILDSRAGAAFQQRAINLLRAAVSLAELMGDSEALKQAQDRLKSARERPQSDEGWHDIVWTEDGLVETARQGRSSVAGTMTGRMAAVGRMERGPAGNSMWIQNAEQFEELARDALRRRNMVDIVHRAPPCPGCGRLFRNPETGASLSVRLGDQTICGRCHMTLRLIEVDEEGATRWQVINQGDQGHERR